ncbi:hypothetical protein D3C72_1622220 [compost metagenome]
MPGAANFSSTTLRSASDPISQLTISFTAQGLGARFSASATPAPAMVWITTPARMKVTTLLVAPASANSSRTPAPAPIMAATGSTQGALAAAPR